MSEGFKKPQKKYKPGEVAAGPARPPKDGNVKKAPGHAPATPVENKKWYNHIYDRQKRTFLHRTCTSWLKIISYAIMYSIFLTTYTLLFLYGSLVIVKNTDLTEEKLDIMYFKSGIGLTVTPTTEHSDPLIWYRDGETGEYRKYVAALDRLVSDRVRRNISGLEQLGPCSKAPYGYGKEPCVLIRINKQWGWAARALKSDSPSLSEAPMSVQEWAKIDSKLWLHCAGLNPHDSEHIGKIRYHPDPPGFDPSVFPLRKGSESPLLGVQFSNFTLGVSIVVECRLWYEDGVSAVDFVLYVGYSRKNINKQ